MQFPFAIQTGSTRILWHTLFETAAFFAGFRYYVYLRKKQGDIIESANRLWIFIAAILGAFAGSRIIGGLENIIALKDAFNKWLYFYQNKTVLGGFVGGLAAVEITKKIIGEHKASGDLFTYPMLLGLIIGRIGCFSMGVYEETYGIPTRLPWGMNLGDGIYRHPVCIYEIIFLATLWLVLIQLAKKYTLDNGSLFKIFMICYFLFRFLLDFIKPHYTFTIGLSTIQLVSLAGLVYYYRYILRPAKLLAENNPARMQAGIQR